MWTALAFLAGDLAALLWPWPIRAWHAPLGAVACVLLLRRAALRPLAAAVGAWALTLAVAHDYLAQRWPAARADDRVLALATLESIPVRGPLGTSFEAALELLRGGRPQRLRARVLWREPPRTLRAGERWQLALRLRPPQAHLNPGAPDAERQFFRDRLHASAAVLDSRLNRRVEAGGGIDRVRESIAQGIRARIAERDAAALLGALAVGHTGGMSREQWRVFNATGTTHLVAISGLHVTLFAVLAFALARRLWAPLARCGLRLTREGFAAWAGLVAATGYALLAGFSVPTQRTLLMLGAWVLARNSGRPAGGARVFSIALVLVLLHDPCAPLAAGFWLSFAAVGTILVLAGARVRPGAALATAVRVQCGVFVLLAPFTLAIFGQLSLVGLGVNFLAIPAFSFALVPLTLAGTAALLAAPAIATAPLALAAQLHALAWPALVAAADAPWAVCTSAPPLAWFVLALPGAAALLLPWPLLLRASGLALCAPLLVPPAAGLAHGDFELTVFDVGRGVAAAVRTRSHTVLFGTGEVHGSRGARAERILLPWLRARGIEHIDALVLERLTPDRAAGIGALLAAGLRLEAVLLAEPWPGARVPAIPCTAGGRWSRDGVLFEVLEVPRARACTLAVHSVAGRAILTGDLEGEAAAVLAARGDLAADVVLVPRGGSPSASPPALAAATAARWAVVPAPAAIARRGPIDAALERWRAAGARVLVTGARGALRFEFDARAGPRLALQMRAGRRLPWRPSAEELEGRGARPAGPV